MLQHAVKKRVRRQKCREDRFDGALHEYLTLLASKRTEDDRYDYERDLQLALQTLRNLEARK